MTRKNLLYAGVVLVVLLGGWALFGGNGDEVRRTVVAEPGDFLQQVSVSGKVVAVEDVELAFEQGGRIAQVNVDVGDEVVEGQVLVSQTLGTLAADLQKAQADLALVRLQTVNTEANLDEVRKQEDTKVESALRQMLSDDLVAEARSSGYDVEPPVISGAYNSSEEGEYKIQVRRDSASAIFFNFSIFGLEQARDVRIRETGPTPLGDRGLFISFPDDLTWYRETTWYVEIPNVKSVSYTANYNAYQEALRARDKAVADAEAELRNRSSGLTVTQVELARAEAEVARIQAQIAQRILRAPFSGLITGVSAEVGGTVSANESVVSLISSDLFEVESFVPEINISAIAVGDRAAVTLDAYGTAVPFDARIISIDPAETIRDGVSTYRVKLQFLNKDERIRSGMTANVVITTEEKQNVIAIPQGAVRVRDGQKFVEVQTRADLIEERFVTTGSISSLGEIEIVSGLSAGDIVVLPEGE